MLPLKKFAVAIRTGMRTLVDDGRLKTLAGSTTPAEVARFAQAEFLTSGTSTSDTRLLLFTSLKATMSTIQIDRLLDTVIKLDASDLHLSVGRKPTLRLHGGLKNLDTKVLDADDTVALMKQITPERNQQEIQEEGGTDFGFAYGDKARFRVSVFRQRGDLTLVLRLIPNRLLTFDEIGLPDICKDLIRRPRGLFIVTDHRIWKNHHLATMLDFINMNYERHIVTAEDPIEYYHYHKKSVVNQREVGADVPSFSEALRRVLVRTPTAFWWGKCETLNDRSRNSGG